MIREAIGRYIFSATKGGAYHLVMMVPGGQTFEGRLPSFDALTKQIASAEDQLRAQHVIPLPASH